ncbi:HAD-like protein [Glarea lozoyensis ATCC 20868]|uniref:HAD-like protein n=1 Tax=Glarea lozoyensis (strain ATCC 20868 / MF5171) TaxID=1116229 RepID=S3CRP5_GLAL2|nr:HAD-like protein [Glarea lozoyensis ATCC 20868]EPE27749.1 HAD-like protein [Glarea lozoyensis ATCC 20868]
MSSFNISATLSLFRLVTKPSLCLPQATVSTFNDLPIPLNKAFEKEYKSVDIRAVVLDKDNCFAWPKENVVAKENEEKFALLKEAYPANRILVASNTAGSSSDPTLSLAETLTKNTNLPVLTHRLKKPSCGPEIMSYFKNHPETGVTHPSHIVVIGDRLTTDVMLANTMGAYSIFISDGVMGREKLTLLARMEQGFARFLMRRGVQASDPGSPFEK